MRKSLAVLSCVGMAGVLSACSGAWDVEGLDTMKVNGNAFDTALKDEYVRLAAWERADYDWSEVASYIDRGKLAAAGTPPQPEEISARSLPSDKVPELTAARGQLMHFLTPDMKTKAPKQLAAAQAGYECWMEQQEENWQWDDIAVCRNKFETAIKALADLEKPKTAKPAPAVAPTVQPFVVYFPFNSAKLQGDALAVIKEAADSFKSQKASRADVSGYADRSGSNAYNDRLSSLRAEAVGDALVKLGVPEAAVTISAFGESDLAVQTPDGQKEPRNRRVIIRVVK